MALSFDRDGFIIGDKRLKELQGDVAQIDKTTQDILAVLLVDAAKQQRYTKQKDKLFSRLLDGHKLTPQKIVQSTTIDGTIKNKHQAGTKLKAAQLKHQTKPMQNGNRLMAKPIASIPADERESDKPDITDELAGILQSATDVIMLGADDQNISPKTDALHEVGEVITPARRAFKVLGQANHTIKKPDKEPKSPTEQQKHHKQTNQHHREVRRLYRLILQKLISSSKSLLLLGLGGVGGLGGLAKNKTTNKKNDDAQKKESQNNHQNNKNNNKANKRPLSPKGKLGAMWSGVVTLLGGILPFLLKPEENNQQNKQPARQDNNQSNSSNRLAIGGGLGAVTAATIAIVSDSISIPLAVLAGGITGLGLTTIVGEQITPYFGRMTDRVGQLWQSTKTITSASVDGSINTIKKGYELGKQIITLVWELANATVNQSIKGLGFAFLSAKQGLFAVVDYIVRGIMAISPNFGAMMANGPSNIKQSFGEFGMWAGQALGSIGSYMTNMTNSITGNVTNNYSVEGGGMSTADAHKMAEYAAQHAVVKSIGRCALYVNNAVRNLGYKAWGHGLESARNIINSNKDFIEVAYNANYVPQDGDIMSIDHGRHQHGHVAIYNARLGKWVSDFVQHKTRGNTAATNDEDYKKIINGKAKVTIARNTRGGSPSQSEIKKETKKEVSKKEVQAGIKKGGPQIKKTDAKNNVPQTGNAFLASGLNITTSARDSSERHLSFSETSSYVTSFFKLLADFKEKPEGVINVIADNSISAPTIDVPIASQSIVVPTFIPKTSNVPRKATLPALSLKTPLFGKSTKSKTTVATVNSKTSKDRLAVHTVAGKNSFI